MSLLEDGDTTACVQRHLGELAEATGSSPVEPVIQKLLARSVGRLQILCSSFLHQSYPRLTRPPLNLHKDELLSSVVERLIKALEKSRPTLVRQYFAMASQHIRWELNDLARRLDREGLQLEDLDSLAVAPNSSGSQLSQNARRILQAIEDLPEVEKEVFGLIRIQGMTQTEAAQIMGISPKTIQRRLNHGIFLLTEALSDLDPGGQSCD